MKRDVKRKKIPEKLLYLKEKGKPARSLSKFISLLERDIQEVSIIHRRGSHLCIIYAGSPIYIKYEKIDRPKSKMREIGKTRASNSQEGNYVITKRMPACVYPPADIIYTLCADTKGERLRYALWSIRDTVALAHQVVYAQFHKINCGGCKR